MMKKINLKMMPENGFTLLDYKDDKELKIIKGCLKNIVYKNDINNFFVARFIIEETERQITIVGQHFEVNSGERLELFGKWEENREYGKQFKVKEIKYLNPITIEGIKRYLGSGLIKGVGPAIAKRIVDRFGLDTIDVLDNKQAELEKIEGLGKKKIKAIKEEWKKAARLREVMMFFQTYGITTAQSFKIFNKYKDDSVNLVKSNPYKLIEDIFGIGFKKADSIAQKMGVEKDSSNRISAGIKYVLKKTQEEGNCFLYYEDLLSASCQLLELERDRVVLSLEDLVKKEKIIITKDSTGGSLRVYDRQIYEDEQKVAKRLIDIFVSRHNKIDIKDKTSIDKLIDSYATRNDILLDREQKTAVEKAILEKMLVITGSPGTGKSTILNIIIRILEDFKCDIMLAAPTGRASKRISETTGKEAKTIHRLLQFNPKKNKFLKNANNQLDADILIVDEASMIDIGLMADLLDALKSETKLILVGDVDQLPSVGPGNVLKDIINSNVLPVVILDKIYRQEGSSKIIINAHRIRDGIYPDLYNTEGQDFYFIESNNTEKALRMIHYLIDDKIPDSFDLDPVRQVQIIVPTNKGTIGVSNLNKEIQEHVNKAGESIDKGGMTYRTGDKVIQLKNNYEKEVFNGDIGFIDKIDQEYKELVIDFNDKKVTYSAYDLDEINLAYAISIHKSQGSEFDCVIIPLLTSHYMLLQRNLLYTALTRAKKISIIIGSKKAIGIALNRDEVKKRFTALRELIITNYNKIID